MLDVVPCVVYLDNIIRRDAVDVLPRVWVAGPGEMHKHSNVVCDTDAALMRPRKTPSSRGGFLSCATLETWAGQR